MRNIVCMLAVPALLLAVNTQPMTALPAEGAVKGGVPVKGSIAQNRGGQDGCVIGVVDTIGGTTYDWQASGPALQMLVNSTDYGIHALWMFSASDQTTFPDRRMRYNFYDYSTTSWNWVDPDFMQSGVNVETERSGFGSLDADPSTGVAVVSCHQDDIYPVVARDMAPGVGIFEYCSGQPVLQGYAWPWVAVGMNGYYHLAMLDYATKHDAYWSRATTWCNWDDPVTIPPPQPQPNFPDHAIVSSRVSGSQKLCLAWEFSEGAPDPGFYRISTDGGTTWDNSLELPWPDAYGADTSVSYHISSLFPYYDRHDRLHFAANVMPYVGGQGYVIPAQIWHWCADNSPNWNHITTATCAPENLQAPVGYNATYACRQSLGEDQEGNLFIVWEQFDSANVEPGPPELLRADIWWSHSSDNGQTWVEPEKITDGGNVSYRFPCMLDYITDTVMVSYMIDQHAGFFIQGEGPATNNPIVLQKWPNPYTGIKEGRNPRPLRMEISAAPNPFDHGTRISYQVPHPGNVSLIVYDIAGRPVHSLVSGLSEPGRFDIVWDGRSDSGKRMGSGVYIYKFILGSKSIAGKLLMTE